MKKTLLIASFLLISFISAAQEKTHDGPVIKDFGKVYQVKNPDLLLGEKATYKVIFDIYTDSENPEELNANINTIARFLNMHAQNGTPSDHLKIVAVLHGEATKNVLSDKAFEKRFGYDNPNGKLIEKLDKAGVQFYVCGQSFVHHGFERKELSRHVKLSLSALTALVYFQSDNYQLITFN